VETTLAITIKTTDDVLTGTARGSIVRWTEGQPKQLYPLFDLVVILPNIEEAGSIAQYAVTALREVSDRGIAQLLGMIATGQGIPVHDVIEQQTH